MPDEKNFIRRIAHEFKDLPADVLKRTQGDIASRLNESFDDGFVTARDICMTAISRQIDELNAKLKVPPRLNNEEQSLLGELIVLKSTIEEELDDARRQK